MEEFSLLSMRKVEDSRIRVPRHTAESSGHCCSELQNNTSSLRFKPSLCRTHWNPSGELQNICCSSS